MWNQFYNGDNNSVAQIYFKIKALHALCELVTVLRIVQSLFEKIAYMANNVELLLFKILYRHTNTPCGKRTTLWEEFGTLSDNTKHQ